MKFIGQYIQSFIARFRNDVYLEDVSTGTIASGSNLGLDSNNKIVKAASTSHDEVTLTGTPDYITISGQEITRNAVDLTADVTGTLPLANGGTGQTSAQAAINALAGSTASGRYLRGNGSNIVMAAIQAADIGTLNQDTTGSAATLTTPRAINGVDFDGSAPITVPAAAGTLSGTELRSTVVTSSLTSVGTIGTGVWQGTAIASAYLDSDTAHLTTNQTFTGVKTFNEAINKKALHFVYTSNKFQLTTATETYFSLADADRDQATGSEDGVAVMMICPLNGILKQVIINTSSDLSSKTWEFRVYRVPSGSNAQGGGEVKIATVASNAGPASHTNKVISFVSATADTNVITYETGYDAETMFTAGDRVLFSLESNSDAAGSPKINATLCFELDESTI